MSKSRSVAPDGQPTHSPKIRIHGIQTGSPVYNTLVDQFRGRLGAFHERHQQQVRLSGNSQYKAKVSWPGVQAMYHNNNGQETITVMIDPVYLEEARLPPVPGYWDFAVIDFHMPELNLTNASMLAVVRPVDVTTIRDDAVYPPQGVTNSSGWVVQDKSPVIAFAGDIGHDVTPFYTDDIVVTGQRLSLRVDLRVVHVEGGALTFDLYGQVDGYRDERLPKAGETVVASVWRAIAAPVGGTLADPYYHVQLGGLGASEVWVRSGTAAKVAAAFPSLPAGIEGKTSVELAAHGRFIDTATWEASIPGWLGGKDPNAWLGMFNNSLMSDGGDNSADWVVDYWAAGIPKTRTLAGHSWAGVGGPFLAPVPEPPPGGDGSTVSLSGFDRTELWCPVVFATPEAECIWSWKLFKGLIADAASRHRHDDDNPETGATGFLYYWQWESGEKYPVRWEMTEDDERITIPRQVTGENESPPISKFYGYTKIGTFTINPAVVGGGVAFEPA